jgi:hypothetical protein
MHGSTPLTVEVVTDAGSGARLVLNHPRVLVVGFSARESAEVERHIAELRREGIDAPDTFPAFYSLPPEILAGDGGTFSVGGLRTSGEVEPVLLVHQGTWYVTVGSDHTDREVERRSIPAAKAAAPKVVARSAWPWADVADHWDTLRLTAWRSTGELYQDGPVALLRAPTSYDIEGWCSGGEDLVVFLGTIPTLGGLAYDRRFRACLTDPVAGRSITLDYCIQPVAG